MDAPGVSSYERRCGGARDPFQSVLPFLTGVIGCRGATGTSGSTEVQRRSLPAVGRYPQQSGFLRCQRSTHWEQAKAIRPRRRWSLALEGRARFPEVDVKVDASIGHDLASASCCCGSQKVPTGRQPHALGHRVQARCGTPPRTGEG